VERVCVFLGSAVNRGLCRLTRGCCHALRYRTTDEGVTLEFFLNPNMAVDAFQAQALVSVESSSMKVVSECSLSTLRSDVEDFLA